MSNKNIRIAAHQVKLYEKDEIGSDNKMDDLINYLNDKFKNIEFVFSNHERRITALENK